MENIFKEMFLIFDGWVNLLLFSLHLKKSKNRHKYLRRYAICNKCKHRKRFTCGLCGCIIRAKVCAEYPISEIDKKSIGGCPANPPLW